MAAALRVTAKIMTGAQQKRAAVIASRRSGCRQAGAPAGASGNWRKRPDHSGVPPAGAAIFREASMGIRNRAVPREASREKTTVRAMSPKTWPATPSTKTMGRNTATVVRVEAPTAMPTSCVPRTTAVRRSSPSSRQRKMLSSTTMPLSTNMPTPRASPPSEMMLSETPAMYMGAKVAMIESGMERPMMTVWTTLRRKR